MNRQAEHIECPQCGSHHVETNWGPSQVKYGTGDEEIIVSANVPYRTCSGCGFEFLDNEAETLRHEALCQHLGVLTPRDIQNLRHQHKVSRSAFARITKLGEATLARWERGELIQNAAYDQFLRLLQTPENFERLRSKNLPTDPTRFEIAARQTLQKEGEAGSPFRALTDIDRALLERQNFELHRKN